MTAFLKKEGLDFIYLKSHPNLEHSPQETPPRPTSPECLGSLSTPSHLGYFRVGGEGQARSERP